MSKAADDVLAERQRQWEREGWNHEHDDEHTDGSLATVAACYAMEPEDRDYSERVFRRDVGRSAGESIIIRDKVTVPDLWPLSWHGGAWKPKDRRRDLVRAAALLIAEIERIDRATQSDRGADAT